MNLNTYGLHYGKFHQCNILAIRQNIMVFRFGVSSYENWLITRLIPHDAIFIDSHKPLLLALKACFRSDVAASVVCNDKYLWTAFLGKERVIFPIGHDVKVDHALQFYATPFYVTDIDVVKQYLKGQIQPPYENVFFHRNTVLYLDNEDLPYSGGRYFEECKPSPFYRLCFLSEEPTDYVVNLAEEWGSREGVQTVPYMTRDVTATPKFIPFRPVSDVRLNESQRVSSDVFHKTLSSRKPEHILQDILNAYYKNATRSSHAKPTEDVLGLLIEWPFNIALEGSRDWDSDVFSQKLVALSVNGMHPSRVLHVHAPYHRYMEYAYVPATQWTPIAYVPATLPLDPGWRKVAVDTVVLGVVYRDAFFCFETPLLEGKPSKRAALNAQYLLSTANFELKQDKKITVLQTFRFSEAYALCRVMLSGATPVNAWCLKKSAATVHPYPKNIQLPDLVKQWTDFFLEVAEKSFDVDVSVMRLVLMLSKHNICFNLTVKETPTEVCRLSDNEIVFYMNEKVVQFVNKARVLKEVEEGSKSSRCVIC